MGFSNAIAMACDLTNARIYVLDVGARTIVVVDTTDPLGGGESQLLSVNGIIANWNLPAGITFVPKIAHLQDGTTWVADANSGNAYSFDTSGFFTLVPIVTGPGQVITDFGAGETDPVVTFAIADATNVFFAGFLPPDIPIAPGPLYLRTLPGSGGPVDGVYVAQGGPPNGIIGTLEFDHLILQTPFDIGTTGGPVGGFSSDLFDITSPIFFPWLDSGIYSIFRYNADTNTPVPASTVLQGNTEFHKYGGTQIVFASDAGHHVLFGVPDGITTMSVGPTLGYPIASPTIFESALVLYFDNGLNDYPAGDSLGVWALAPTHLYRWTTPSAGPVVGTQHVIQVPIDDTDFTIQAQFPFVETSVGVAVDFVTPILTTNIGVPGNIVLSLVGVPSGITATLDDSTIAAGDPTILRVHAGGTLAGGTHTFQISGSKSFVTHTTDFSVEVSGLGLDGVGDGGGLSAVRENVLRVRFNTPIYFSQLLDAKDGSIPAKYVVTTISSTGLDGQPVHPCTPVRAAVAADVLPVGSAVDLTLDRPMSPFPCRYAVAISNVWTADKSTPIDGDLSTASTFAVFKRVVVPTLDAPLASTGGDIANPQTQSDAAAVKVPLAKLGSFAVDETGDYASDSGLVSFKIRIYRRIVTAPGGFAHLGASYGAGIATFGKQLATPHRRAQIQQLIEQQVSQEPETLAAKCTIVAGQKPGLWIVQVLVQTRSGKAAEVRVPVRFVG